MSILFIILAIILGGVVILAGFVIQEVGEFLVGAGVIALLFYVFGLAAGWWR